MVGAGTWPCLVIWVQVLPSYASFARGQAPSVSYPAITGDTGKGAPIRADWQAHQMSAHGPCRDGAPYQRGTHVNGGQHAHSALWVPSMHCADRGLSHHQHWYSTDSGPLWGAVSPAMLVAVTALSRAEHRFAHFHLYRGEDSGAYPYRGEDFIHTLGWEVNLKKSSVSPGQRFSYLEFHFQRDLDRIHPADHLLVSNRALPV